MVTIFNHSFLATAYNEQMEYVSFLFIFPWIKMDATPLPLCTVAFVETAQQFLAAMIQPANHKYVYLVQTTVELSEYWHLLSSERATRVMSIMDIYWAMDILYLGMYSTPNSTDYILRSVLLISSLQCPFEQLRLYRDYVPQRKPTLILLIIRLSSIDPCAAQTLLNNDGVELGHHLCMNSQDLPCATAIVFVRWKVILNENVSGIRKKVYYKDCFVLETWDTSSPLVHLLICVV